MKQSEKFFVIFSLLIIFSSLSVSAVPIITINSPQATSYDSTKIILNISSNEPADFFFKNLRTGERRYILQNATNLESFIYVNQGVHEFKIWANNSNGESNASVVFSTSQHNPIDITDCGFLSSSDTRYVLNNDIKTSPGNGVCIYASSIRNSTIDLNGHTISAGTDAGVNHAMDLYGSNIELFNGTINGSHLGSPLTFLLVTELSKGKIYNLRFNGFLGMWIFNMDDVILNNITMNTSVGVWNLGTKNTHFVNSSFSWDGVEGTGSTGCFSSAFCDWSGYSEIFLQNITITGFPNQDFYLRGALSDFYLRNTNIDLSKVSYPDWVADMRIFTQHLILINVTDQLNKTGSGVIEVEDNGLFPHSSEDFGDDFSTLVNPTDNLLIATDENGTASTWLTEKLTYAKSSSPAVVYDYDFSDYELIARSWDANASITLNLTGHHSTIPVSFTLNVPTVLPGCTISEMLDLNNDGNNDILDALIVLKYITGKQVDLENSKNCTAVGF